MKTYMLKTTNQNCKSITIEAIHIWAAMSLAMEMYHGLIEEEITSVKEQ